MAEKRAKAYDTQLGLKVTADAKEHLSLLKAKLRRKGHRVSEQAIVDVLILAADAADLESHFPKKKTASEEAE